MINALGIDVEEWYHICGLNLPTNLNHAYSSRVEKNTEKILEILDVMKAKATFFVLGAVAKQFPNLIKKIDAAEHEIASHGYQHLEIFKYSPDAFREDVKRSKAILEDLSGKPVLGYRAPQFSIVNKSLWALDILVEEGFQYDCSIFPIRHPRYGIPSAPRVHYRIRPELVEFPLSTIRVLGDNLPIAGGAYFRLLPYCFTKKAIESLNKENIVVNSYFHVWEIDPNQPRLKIPFKRRFPHYVNLKSAQRKFEQLLADFQYAPIKKVIEDGRF